jgi:hypothetical protein
MSKPKRTINLSSALMDSSLVGRFDELAATILVNESNPYIAKILQDRRSSELAVVTAIVLASWAVDNPKKSKSILGFSVVGCEFTQVLGRLLEKMVISKNRGAA